MARPELRDLHKWTGLALLLPLAVWTLTGLLFALKPGWGPAYEQLSPWSAESPATAQGMNFTTFAQTQASVNVASIELHESAIGPVYRVVGRGESAGTRLHSAGSGERIDPLSLDHARVLVDAAIAKSIDPGRYGEHQSQTVGAEAIDFEFANGPIVTIDLHTARLRQRGPDTDRIDWLYQMHYIQWTGNAVADRILGFACLVLVWLLAAAGVVLAWRGRKQGIAC